MRALLLALATVTLALPAARAGSEAWHYAIGEPRPEQQVNLCDREDDVRELAGIFRKFTPRTGYAALAHAPGCRVTVTSLVPVRIVGRIVIAAGKPNEYVMSFVEVDVPEGPNRYLVTTREVRE